MRVRRMASERGEPAAASSSKSTAVGTPQHEWRATRALLLLLLLLRARLAVLVVVRLRLRLRLRLRAVRVPSGVKFKRREMASTTTTAARRPTTVEHVFILNPAGGLIYYLSWGGAQPLPSNDALRVGSTFHSLHAIATQVSPVAGGGGIAEVETAQFSLRCLQSPTGVKFFATAAPGTRDVEGYLRAVHELYADWVLKDPFYELDMPIRVDKFDERLTALTSERFPRVV